MPEKPGILLPCKHFYFLVMTSNDTPSLPQELSCFFSVSIDSYKTKVTARVFITVLNQSLSLQKNTLLLLLYNIKIKTCYLENNLKRTNI